MARALAVVAVLTAAVAPAWAGGYPLEVRAPFDVGLFHWLDSLAGTSGGKTIPIYQQEFRRRFGEPTARDAAMLRSFRRARTRHAAVSANGAANRGPAAMLGTFLEHGTEEGAISHLSSELPAADGAALRKALAHFRPRYELIWNDAEYLFRFVERLEGTADRRAIEGYLSDMARFFDVDPAAPPHARLLLVPVPRGGGTHAQAVGRNLLLEIRPGDTPRDQASVIAHENAHFLFDRISRQRKAALRRAAIGAGPGGETTWRHLREGLPTALGQGVARKRLQPKAFAMSGSWYHVEEVDRLAKRIFPVVERAMEDGRTLDEDLIRAIVKLTQD